MESKTTAVDVKMKYLKPGTSATENGDFQLYCTKFLEQIFMRFLLFKLSMVKDKYLKVCAKYVLQINQKHLRAIIKLLSRDSYETF